MNPRKITTSIVGGLVLSSGFSTWAIADAHADVQFVGHRARTWPDRSHTNENTADALRILGGSERPGQKVWAETDVWNLRDNSDFVWHDPTWGGAARHTTIPYPYSSSSLVREATLPQALRVHTTAGARSVTPAQFVTAAGRYGVGTVLLEAKNSIGHEGAINAAADAAHVRVWAYKPDVDGDCAVDIPGWSGPIGVKVNRGSRCTPAAFARNGVRFVTERVERILRHGCDYAEGYRKRGIAVVITGTDRSTYRHQLKPCGLDRIMQDRVDEAVQQRW